MLQRDRVSDVDVARRRVDAELDAKRPALGQLALELALGQHLHGVAGERGEVGHRAILRGPARGAWPTRPGPLVSSRSGRSPRRCRIRSSPQTGSSARISTPAPTPGGPHEMFMHQWMPYDRYT